MPHSDSNETRVSARQTRDAAMRLAEENYKKELEKAASDRAAAIAKATSDKAAAVSAAKEASQGARKDLAEARDRIEKKLRAQALDRIVQAQEKLILQAEYARIKAIQDAEQAAKTAAAQAADRRQKAIELARHTEDETVRSAKEAIKTAYANERLLNEQARQKAVAEAKQKDEDVRAQRERASRELQESARAAQENRLKELKEAAALRKAQTEFNKALSDLKDVKVNRKRKIVLPVIQPEVGPRTAGDSPVDSNKQAETELSPVAGETQPTSTTSPEQQAGETTDITETSATPQNTIMRNGLIRIKVEGSGRSVADFVQALHGIRGLRVMMVGSGGQNGAEIAVKTESEIPLSGVLRLLPEVEKATDFPDYIAIVLHKLAV
jgi:hypothetical protein